MVKDHSNKGRGNPLPPHMLLFVISSKGVLLYASSHRQDNTYHSLCYTSRGALTGMRLDLTETTVDFKYMNVVRSGLAQSFAKM